MKTLELNQMEELQGGDMACGLAVVGMAAAVIGLVTLTAATGGWAVFGAVLGFNAASAGVVSAC
tara:strand:- start:1788 stop:1979 length:192 start_codon:yes stop_codon:yes gene_type:complete